MKKYIFPLIVILLLTGFFIRKNMKNSELTNNNVFAYDTKQQALDHKSDERFAGFDAIYEYEFEPHNYIIVYYDDSEDFLCAALIEEIDNHFYWDRITPYFSIKKAAILSEKGAYVIDPIVINDEEFELCLGIRVDETEIKSDDDVHIFNDNFFMILKEGKINVELL